METGQDTLDLPLFSVRIIRDYFLRDLMFPWCVSGGLEGVAFQSRSKPGGRLRSLVMIFVFAHNSTKPPPGHAKPPELSK